MAYNNLIARSAANPPPLLLDDVSALGGSMDGYKPPKKAPAKRKPIKTTGTYAGKSNKLGHGGRAAQLRAQGVPEGVIGELARKAQAAPGQKNYHGKRGK